MNGEETTLAAVEWISTGENFNPPKGGQGINSPLLVVKVFIPFDTPLLAAG